MKKTLGAIGLVLMGSLATLATVYAIGGGVGLSFPDVKSRSWYEQAVINMTAKGVIHGYKNGNFGPGDTVTRAQAVVMLDQYDKTQIDDDLLAMICTGFKKENFPENHPYFGNTRKTFEKMCPQEAP